MGFWIIWVIFLLLLFAAVPAWPYSRRWGYYPGGAIFLWLILLLILWWFAWLPGWGRYPWWR